MDTLKRHQLLVSRLAEKASDVEELLGKMEAHSGIETNVYRFYHQSCKVYGWQEVTLEAVALLQSLLPERPLNARFMQIVKEAHGKEIQALAQRELAAEYTSDS